MTFSVATDPWIPTLTPAGQVRDVSIAEALTGHSTRICSEIATMDAAIMRLLAAVRQRSQGHIDAYLAQQPGRWLLDRETPFMQTPGLSPVGGGHNPVSELMPAARHFTQKASDTLTLPEAARWLVHLQAFDRSGIRPGMAGDPEVTKGKGMPRGSGWAARSTHILPDTGHLADSIDLISHTPQPDAPAAWERTATPARRTDGPQGVSDLLTWQTRRVRLVIDADQVTGCIIGQGDRVDEPTPGMDPTMLWGKRGPVRATGPAWWILGREDLILPPWLDNPPDIVTDLRLITAHQGTTASTWEDVRADTLNNVPLARLTDITRGCRAGQRVVSALADLAGHLVGIDGAGPATQDGESTRWRDHAKEELTAAIQTWISHGGTPEDWQSTARPGAIEIFTRINQTAPLTLKRRPVNGIEMDRGKATAYFHANIRRAAELASGAESQPHP